MDHTREEFMYARSLSLAAAVFITIGLLGAVYAIVTGQPAMPPDAKAFMILWGLLSLLATLWLTRLDFMTGFLVGVFCLFVSLQISVLHSVHTVVYPLFCAFICFLFQFFHVARRDIHAAGTTGRQLSVSEWHITFLRIYLGLDLVPHFTEKLFAGHTLHMASVNQLSQLGFSDPEFMVWLAGLCELGAAIGIGLGLLTRLAAPCAALYILIATMIGHHFSDGFTWSDQGGGWEYPVMWAILLLSFVYTGAGRFSLDHVLLRLWAVPPWLAGLMVRRGLENQARYT